MLSAFFVLTVVLFCARVYAVLPRRKPKVERRSGNLASPTCTLAVFLGSGGHTSEMLGLVSALNFSRYTPRIYIISEGDPLSGQKVIHLETKTKLPRNKMYRILTIPRARRVHQSMLSTPPTALTSLAACIYHITINPTLHARAFSDILLLNGPGTCFILCITVYVNKLFGLPAPKLVVCFAVLWTDLLSSGHMVDPANVMDGWSSTYNLVASVISQKTKITPSTVNF